MIDLLNDQSKQGAIDALTMILNSRSRKIRVKNDLDNSEEDDEYKLNLPKNVEIEDVDEAEAKEAAEEGSELESEEEHQARLQRIAQENEPEALEQTLKDIQNDRQSIEDKRKKQLEKDTAEQKLADKFKQKQENEKLLKKGKPIDFTFFEDDLVYALKKQLHDTNRTEDSYERENPIYAGGDLIMSSEVPRERKNTVSIAVYLDLSGSLDRAEDRLAEENTVNAIKELKKSNKHGVKLEYKVFYFADNVSDNPNKVSGSTEAFPVILKHVQENHFNNVIIFTDDDFDDQTLYLHYDEWPNSPFKSWADVPTVAVSGCVWWIWGGRDGRQAKSAAKHLVSRRPNRNFQYTIN